MLTLLKKYNNQDDGFTLIELLIVVLIIGILAAIAIPVYLGIQNQAHKSAIKADVNVAVKQVQVSLTEGQNISALYGTKAGSDKGETVQVKASTTTGASSNDFMVVGTESTPTGAVNYTYTYDSVTGQFTDSDTTVGFGGGNQAGFTTVTYDFSTSSGNLQGWNDPSGRQTAAGASIGGKYALQLSDSAATATESMSSPTITGLTVGNTYTVQGLIYINGFTSSGYITAGGASSNVVTTNGWKPVTLTFTATSSSTQISVVMNGTAGRVCQIYLNTVSLSQN